MQSEIIFQRSRKRAIATGSGEDWQGPGGGISLVRHSGARASANPESPAITSGFRVRGFASPRNDEGEGRAAARTRNLVRLPRDSGFARFARAPE
jgi:hypothetical protein